MIHIAAAIILTICVLVMYVFIKKPFQDPRNHSLLCLELKFILSLGLWSCLMNSNYVLANMQTSFFITAVYNLLLFVKDHFKSKGSPKRKQSSTESTTKEHLSKLRRYLFDNYMKHAKA